METDKTLQRPAGVTIHYRVSTPDSRPSTHDAALPTLMLIHGVASNLSRWTEFLLNTSLRERSRIIRLDLRGHSRSQTDIAVGMDSWCDDLAALLQQEQLDAACLVGHSLGAQVAMNFAFRYPQMASGLVLIDPVVPEALKGKLLLGRYLRYALLLLANSVSAVRRLGLGRRSFLIRDLYKLDQATRETMVNHPATNLARLYHSPSADMQFIPFSNYVRDLCEVLRPLPPLQRIGIPVLALLARAPSISEADKNRQVLSRIPGIRFETIDADHWPLTEKPVETREAIEAWFNRLWQTSGAAS